MRAAFVSLAGLATLAGCSPNEEGMKAINDQCLAGGDTVEVCDCLARETAARLEQSLFDIVVLGARRDDAEAAAKMEDLTPDQERKFMTAIPEIRELCRVGEATG